MPQANKRQSGLLDSWGRKNRKIEDKKCESCGVLFRPADSKKRTCSRACGYSIRSNGAEKLRKKEVWWKNAKGYIEGRIWIDEHTQIRVKQHRWVIENSIGRKLLKNEDVHHINGIKSDNRIENLQIIDHVEHTRLTNKREYKKGYTLNISHSERERRALHMKKIRIIKKAKGE